MKVAASSFWASCTRLRHRQSANVVFGECSPAVRELGEHKTATGYPHSPLPNILRVHLPEALLLKMRCEHKHENSPTRLSPAYPHRPKLLASDNGGLRNACSAAHSARKTQHHSLVGAGTAETPHVSGRANNKKIENTRTESAQLLGKENTSHGYPRGVFSRGSRGLA